MLSFFFRSVFGIFLSFHLFSFLNLVLYVFLISCVFVAVYDFNFRWHKVCRIHYFRLIYSMLICQHKKRWFSFPFRVFFLFHRYIYDFSFRAKIDLFIQAIEMNPAVVSLKGYANVNRELLTAVSVFNSSIQIFFLKMIISNSIPNVSTSLLFVSQLLRSQFIWLSYCNSNYRSSVNRYRHPCMRKFQRNLKTRFEISGRTSITTLLFFGIYIFLSNLAFISLPFGFLWRISWN